MARVQYKNHKKTFYGNTEEEAIKKTEDWYSAQLEQDSNIDNKKTDSYNNSNDIKILSDKIDILMKLINNNVDTLESKELLKPYITVSELSSILKITKNRAYELVNRSDFPKVKIGKCIRIPQMELEKYLKHNLYKEIKIK